MNKRPILFSSEMVRAIMDGRKTQTRRVIKPQPLDDFSWAKRGEKYPRTFYKNDDVMRTWMRKDCPYGQPGDWLWVREAWATHPFNNKIKPSNLNSEKTHIFYREDTKNKESDFMWRPSIFMPKWACRIMLEIARVRVERVQEITPEDAKAEGGSNVWTWTPDRDVKYFRRCALNPWVANYSVLWDTINTEAGKRWEDNPWVWVVEFRRMEV